MKGDIMPSWMLMFVVYLAVTMLLLCLRLRKAVRRMYQCREACRSGDVVAIDMAEERKIEAWRCLMISPFWPFTALYDIWIFECA